MNEICWNCRNFNFPSEAGTVRRLKHPASADLTEWLDYLRTRQMPVAA